MPPKYTQTSVFVSIMLLHACASPLAIPVDTNTGAALPVNPSVTLGLAPETTHEITPQINTVNELVHNNFDEYINLPHTERTAVQKALEHREEELNILTPANTLSWDSETGQNLHLEQSTSARLSLNEAVFSSLENNLDIRIAVLQPQIAQQATVSAEAVFDFVFGAGVSKKKSRIPQQQIIGPGGAPLNSDESSSDQLVTNASLIKQLYSGGTITLSTDIVKSESEATGFTYSPDPAWQTVGKLELNQPLLRNFGEPVTLAQVQLLKITKIQSDEDVRESLNLVVSLTEKAYFDLCLQWKTLQIKQWLLLQGEQVVEVLELRRSYDTSEADFAQAVATVQQRTADVIQQQAAVQTTSDTLKKLINSDLYPLDSEKIIQPVGELVATPISVSLRQAMVTAATNRPDLRKLSLQIQSSDIDLEVSDNALLPKLDAQAQMSFYGLGDNAGDGYSEVFGGDYVNYLLGLSLQIPLGNRSAEANHQSARLKKMSAVTSYKRGLQQATIEVKTALRNIVTNAALIQANKSFRVAQTENLRALLVEEETMAGLTPTFLNLKLQTQAGLASARTAELRSIVDYNKAISSLFKATGTSLDQRQISYDE
jgi:outer membrane protein